MNVYINTGDSRVAPDGQGGYLVTPPGTAFDGWWVRPDGSGWITGKIGDDQVWLQASTDNAAIRAVIGMPEAWKRTAYADDPRVDQHPNGPFIVEQRWAVCPNEIAWLVFPWPDSAREGYQGEPVAGPADTADELIHYLIGDPR